VVVVVVVEAGVVVAEAGEEAMDQAMVVVVATDPLLPHPTHPLLPPTIPHPLPRTPLLLPHTQPQTPTSRLLQQPTLLPQHTNNQHKHQPIALWPLLLLPKHMLHQTGWYHQPMARNHMVERTSRDELNKQKWEKGYGIFLSHRTFLNYQRAKTVRCVLHVGIGRE